MSFPRIALGCCLCLLLSTLQPPTARSAELDSGFANKVRAHLETDDADTDFLGPHFTYLINTSGMSLHFEPIQVEDWPTTGNGIEADIGSFDVAPRSARVIHYTIHTNSNPYANPFVMSRKFRMLVWEQGKPELRVPWTLTLMAHVDVTRVLRVSLPAVGDDGSYTCATAQLEHMPPHLQPVHCRNARDDARADSHPLILTLDLVDPSDGRYIQPLLMQALYRVRDAAPCAAAPIDAGADSRDPQRPDADRIDLAQGSQTWSVTPQPGRSFVLEPVVPGLPRIDRRRHGEEGDVVLELVRRPDLMDPRTRVDTVQAACIGTDCAEDNALEIDAIERVDDIGHGFDAPPPDDASRYAPDGELRPGMRLSPGSAQGKAEVAWRITDGSQGRYVESHYVVRYHDRDGHRFSLVSSPFGGILEPSPGSAGAAAAVLRTDPPWWVHEQLPGPFMNLSLPDASGQRKSVALAAPALDSQIRLISAMQVAPNLGSASIVGMPRLNVDGTVHTIKVLGALHVLMPLFYNGLSRVEYMVTYHGPIELAVSGAWFDRNVDWNDPVRASLNGWATVGHTFRTRRNARIVFHTMALAGATPTRIPDVAVYTIFPDEELRLDPLALVRAPTLTYGITPMLQTQPRPLALGMAGYPQGAAYEARAHGTVPIAWMPMVWTPLPALDVGFSPGLPINSHLLRLGRGADFSYDQLDPSSGAVMHTGNDLKPLHGIAGAAMLGEPEWSSSGALASATVHGVASSTYEIGPGGDKLLNYVGFDVDVSNPGGALLYEWLNMQLL